MRGNHGRDLITGGTGADRFVMRPGNGRSGDVITDFDPGQGDRLVFEAVNPATVRWSLSPDGVVVTYDRADWLLLQGVLALAPDAILFV